MGSGSATAPGTRGVSPPIAEVVALALARGQCERGELSREPAPQDSGLLDALPVECSSHCRPFVDPGLHVRRSARPVLRCAEAVGEEIVDPGEGRVPSGRVEAAAVVGGEGSLGFSFDANVVEADPGPELEHFSRFEEPMAEVVDEVEQGLAAARTQILVEAPRLIGRNRDVGGSVAVDDTGHLSGQFLIIDGVRLAVS